MPSAYKEAQLEQKGYTFTGNWTRVCTHKKCHARFRVAAPRDAYRQVAKTPCPKCGWVTKDGNAWMAYIERIWGRHSAEVACSSKCLNAKGPSCDCACGGENHGAGHNGGPSIETVAVAAAPANS